MHLPLRYPIKYYPALQNLQKEPVTSCLTCFSFLKVLKKKKGGAGRQEKDPNFQLLWQG